MKFNIGTLFEIKTEKGYVYGVYALEHDLDGSLLKLIPFQYPTPIRDPTILFHETKQYRSLFTVGDLFLQGQGVEVRGEISLSQKLQSFPLFRTGVIAPEIGLFQEIKIYDGINSHPQSTFPHVNVQDLPAREVLPKREILKIANAFPVPLEY
jgi:hypothetical protein